MDAIDKLKGMIYILEYVKKDISSLRQVYRDDRGNLDDSESFISDVLLNLNGHLQDLREGIE